MASILSAVFHQSSTFWFSFGAVAGTWIHAMHQTTPWMNQVPKMDLRWIQPQRAHVHLVCPACPKPDPLLRGFDSTPYTQSRKIWAPVASNPQCLQAPSKETQEESALMMIIFYHKQIAAWHDPSTFGHHLPCSLLKLDVQENSTGSSHCEMPVVGFT